MRELQAKGLTLKQIADELNKRGLKTLTGLPWTFQLVWNVMTGRKRRAHRRPYSGEGDQPEVEE